MIQRALEMLCWRAGRQAGSVQYKMALEELAVQNSWLEFLTKVENNMASCCTENSVGHPPWLT